MAGYNSSSYMTIASAAGPAVSVRRMVFPKVTEYAPFSIAVSTSCLENPPSGPMITAKVHGVFSKLRSAVFKDSFSSDS